MFNSYVTNYRKVNPMKPPFSYGFPRVNGSVFAASTEDGGKVNSAMCRADWPTVEMRRWKHGTKIEV